MEAKDTVYSKSVTKRLAVQAPIPFEGGRKAGIREVVEEIDKRYHSYMYQDATGKDAGVHFTPREWQEYKIGKLNLKSGE